MKFVATGRISFMLHKGVFLNIIMLQRYVFVTTEGEETCMLLFVGSIYFIEVVQVYQSAILNVLCCGCLKSFFFFLLIS